MKKMMYSFKKMQLVALCLALFCGNANATVYTAVLSGDFNSALTWGGILPGSLLTSDVIVIPSGINVTLTNVQTLSGTTSLAVNGTLSSTAGSALVMPSGTLSGSGTMTLDSAALGLTSGFTFTGAMITGRLTTTGLSVASAANITVNNTLYLSSGVLNMSAGNLTMGNNSTIVRYGGSLTSSGTGMLNLNNPYNVTYLATAATAGAELAGSGLNNVSVDNASNVTLSAATTLNGMLTLTAGDLMLNGQTLTFGTAGNFAATGTGAIMGTASSNIVVNATAGLTGALRFAAGGNTVNNLVINTGAANMVALGSDMTANGIVTLTNGMLSLNGHALTIGNSGNIAASGTGSIMGSTTSDIIVNATAGLTGALRFATGGNMLNNLTINTGAGSNTMLGSDLTTSGMMTLTSGILALNGHTLTLGSMADLASSGSGTIMGSSTSSLVINSTAGLTGMLRFATGGNTLNNLTVNTGAGNNATLGSDLNLTGMLTLSSGTFAMNSYDLVFGTTANLAATGSGTLSGDNASDITVNATTGLSGAIRFATSANTINNLIINTGSAGNVSLGSNAVVHNLLTLSNGTLSLNGNTLTFDGTGDLAASGAGTITGSSTSNIIVNASSGLTGMLNFTSGSNTLNNLTINGGSGNDVMLGSDLTLGGMLTLSSGSLVLGGNTLTFGSTGNVATTGSGNIMGSSAANIIVNSTAGLAGALNFGSGGNMLNDLTVNTGAGNGINLGTALTIDGSLHLQSGTISLGSNNLMIATTGSVTGGSSNSYVRTNGSGSLVMNLATNAAGTFQVGSATNYAPMTINANAGAATGDVSINVADGVLSGGTTGSSLSATGAMVDATWFVTSTATSIDYDMTAMWSAAMEVNGFDRSHAYISHYTGGAWDTYTTGAATTSGSLYAMSRTGITSLSPFMVNQGTVPVGTSNIATAQSDISIYPNPTVNVLHFTAGAGISGVSIYDMTGKCVLTASAINSEVNVSDLATGAYIIHFTGNETDVTKHFVKQ